MLAWVLFGLLLNRSQDRRYNISTLLRFGSLCSNKFLLLFYQICPIAFGCYLVFQIQGFYQLAENDYFGALVLILRVFLFPYSLGIVLFYVVNDYLIMSSTGPKQKSDWRVTLFNILEYIIFGGLIISLALNFFAANKAIDSTASVTLYFFVVLSILANGFIKRKLFSIEDSLPIEMEDSPLVADLQKVTSHFGRLKKPWRLVPLSKKNKSADLSDVEIAEAFKIAFLKFKPFEPTLSIVFIQNLSPNAILARVAFEYSSRMKPADVRLIGFMSHSLILLCLVVFFFLISISIVAATDWYIASMIFFLLGAFSITILYIRSFMFVSEEKRLLTACDIWQKTQPEGMTCLDFMSYLMEYDEKINYDFDQLQLLQLMAQSKGKRKFLQEHGYTWEQFSEYYLSMKKEGDAA